MNPWRIFRSTLLNLLLLILQKFYSRLPVHPALVNFSAVRRMLVVPGQDRLRDFFMTTPALRALRQHFPQAQITAVVCDSVAEMALHDPSIDSVIAVPDRLVGWSWKRIRQVRVKLHEGFDLAIVFNTVTRLLTSDLLAAWSHSTFILGSGRWRYPNDHRNFFYDLEAPYWDRPRHRIERNLDIARHIGVDASNLRLQLELLPEELAEARQFLRDRGIADDDLLITLHLGAHQPLEQWPVERFAALAALLHHDYGIKILTMWGPGEEGLGAEFLQALDFEPCVASGRTLRQAAALVACSRVLICNAGGVMCIGASLDALVIAIFGAPDPDEWKPIGDHVVAVRASSHHCADVGSDLVLEALKELLGEKLSSPPQTTPEPSFDISEGVLQQYQDVLSKFDKNS